MIDRVGRFLGDQYEMTSVLVDAYHASAKGMVFVRQSTAFRAHIFKGMCADFLRKNHINNFRQTKNSIQFEGRYKIVFGTVVGAIDGSGIYKII